jgi:cation transport ATPase
MAKENLLLPIHGMHCASCAMLIERTLSEVPGVTKAEVNSVSEKLSLEFDSSKTPLETIVGNVRDLGYELVLPEKRKDHAGYSEHNAHKEHDHSKHDGHDHSSPSDSDSSDEGNSFPMETKIALTLAAITAFAMVWDVLGKLGWIPEMGNVERNLFHEAMPIFSAVLLSTVGRGYFGAVWRFFRTGNA